MKGIAAFVNENWEKVLRVFGVEIIKEKNEILKNSINILFLSEDKKKEIEDILQKIEENEIIITELPSSKDSKSEIDNIQRLISKVLGISLKK